ncbi:outer membrane lipoprotein carrier protein LolA [Geobacter sp. DSM 9736]|uniref:LolA family protein n=1 Tax=Geobacter sp. DSM 9736 TaxID=1277350 RepID=UPI000B513BA3|nr:outer membrane lipoprotein carrier protein LolA [Geobacter sp. DSM 9736]SNB47432.1 Outer membrane lipoprotein-sorting protein [Geobacter sp. DSM 9736]
MLEVRRIALSLLALFLVVPAHAAVQTPVGLRDVVATVENAFKPDSPNRVRDVTADFMQSSTLVEKGRDMREMRGDGQMFLRTATEREPLMFRFDYFRPTTQQIVSDGRTMWMYLPANRQVIQSDVSFVFNPFNFNPERTRATNFLQGLGRISKDFLITFSSEMQDIEGNYILELQPRRVMATIDRLLIVVSREAVLSHVDPSRFPPRQELLFPIRSTTMTDREGNSTIMEFSNIRTNSRLSESIFFFVVPPDVQVVRPPTTR